MADWMFRELSKQIRHLRDRVDFLEKLTVDLSRDLSAEKSRNESFRESFRETLPEQFKHKKS